MKARVISLILAAVLFTGTLLAAVPVPAAYASGQAVYLNSPVSGMLHRGNSIHEYTLVIPEDCEALTFVLNAYAGDSFSPDMIEWQMYLKSPEDEIFAASDRQAPDLAQGEAGWVFEYDMVPAGNYGIQLSAPEYAFADYDESGEMVPNGMTIRYTMEFKAALPSPQWYDPDEISAWAQADVDAAIAAGLVPPDLQRNYTSPITRGAMALILINLIEKAAGMTIDDLMTAKGVTVDNNAFSDVSDYYAADRAILAANALGILNGGIDGRFDPKGTLTRAQLAAITSRTANVLGIATTGYGHSFTDMRGHWAESELGWAVHAGVINGVGGGRFDPDSPLTVEQAILIIFRSEGALTDGAAVSATPADGQEITLDRTFYNPGDKITVTIEGVTAKMYRDKAFIGIYKHGAEQDDYLTRKYIAENSDTLEFFAPEDYGDYDMRLHSEDYQSDETLLTTRIFTVIGSLYEPDDPEATPTVPNPSEATPTPTPVPTPGQGEKPVQKPTETPGQDPVKPEPTATPGNGASTGELAGAYWWAPGISGKREGQEEFYGVRFDGSNATFYVNGEVIRTTYVITEPPTEDEAGRITFTPEDPSVEWWWGGTQFSPNMALDFGTNTRPNDPSIAVVFNSVIYRSESQLTSTREIPQIP